jgi:hypothetical protein
MPNNPDLLTRRSVLLLTGAVVGLLGIGFGPRVAFADDGEGEDGNDEGDDNSGHGGGDEDGGDDNSGEDNGGDDNGGGDDDGGDDNGGGDDNSGQGGGDDSGGDTRSSGQGSERPRNVTVRYSDGWTELILDGQYQLIDNLNRQVVQRRATIEDFNRMVALGS